MDRFWSKADTSGGRTSCWLWTAGRYPQGYGKFYVGGKTELAHRVSYQISTGPIPKGMNVCHACDTPACVNPAHLWLGDTAANFADCASKGRHAQACLTPAEIQQIRKVADRGVLQEQIAKAYGVTQSTISRVVTGKTWRHVT